ncbi:MAG: LamG domain-containing protein, partial [Planctomycetota bacterium]
MLKKANLRLMAVAVMVVLIGTGSARADLTDGLIAHWTFDEGSGGTAYDSVGGNDGTLVNGPIWTTGQIDGALEFDGSNDYVEVPYIPDYQLPVFTVSAWVYAAAPDLTGAIVTRGEDVTSDNSALNFCISEWGGVLLTYEDNSDNSHDFPTNYRPPSGIWTYLTASRAQDGEIKIYANGIPIGQWVSSATPTNKCYQKILVGAYWYRPTPPGYPTGFFPGAIDDVRVYDRALSSEEVEELYRGELLGLEVVGPDEVAENFQAQYNSIANYERADIDVTALADWSVEPNSDCSIASGLLTTEMVDLPEDVTITAQYGEDPNTEIAQKDVSILPICPSGSALELDGVNDYVEVLSNASLKTSNSLTIELWFKPDVDITPALNHFISLVNKHQGENSGLGYVLQFDNGSGGNRGALRFVVGNGTSHICVSNKDNWSAGVWYHVGVSYEPTADSKNVKFFVNGVLDAVVDMKELIGTHDDPLYIGSEIGIRQYFGGILDEVRVWDVALTEVQMLTLMHTRPDTGEPNLVGYWDFDEGEGQVAYDKSGNGNDGVLGSSLDPDDSDP